MPSLSRQNALLPLLAACALCAPPMARAGDEKHADGCERRLPQWQNASVSEWNQALLPWPAYGQNLRILMPFEGYVSLRFTTGATPGAFGSFRLGDYPQSGGGSGVISISRTPGCFDPAFVGANGVSPVSGEPGIAWIIAASELRCALQANTS